MSARTSSAVELCRVAGIPLRAERGFLGGLGLLILFLLVVHGGEPRGWRLAGSVVLVLLSVLWHEGSHALAARAIGLPVVDIRLHLLFGMTRMVPPRSAREELLVAGAGPAGSLVLAGLVALARLGVEDPGGVAAALCGILLPANLVLGLLNLVPAFPMDGGRLLRGLLVPRLGLLRATRIARAAGVAIAAAMIAAPLVRRDEPVVFALPVVGLVVLVLGEREWRRTRSAPAEGGGEDLRPR